MIGESPTRPGSLWASPEVVQTPPRWPLASSASTVTVSWLKGGSPPPDAFFFGAGAPGRRFSHSARLSGVLQVLQGKTLLHSEQPGALRRPAGRAAFSP